MLSYFKYYIIKTQQARKSIVLKLCGLAMPLRSGLMFGVCGPTSGRVLGAVLGGVEISLTSGIHELQHVPKADIINMT